MPARFALVARVRCSGHEDQSRMRRGRTKTSCREPRVSRTRGFWGCVSGPAAALSGSINKAPGFAGGYLLSTFGRPAMIYTAWYEGQFTLLTCQEQLKEF